MCATLVFIRGPQRVYSFFLACDIQFTRISIDVTDNVRVTVTGWFRAWLAS